VNIGNPAEFTMLELASEVLRLTGTHGKLAFKPLPADDPRQRQPDIALARGLLRWQPQVALAEGLDKTSAYFRDRLLADHGADLAALARIGRRQQAPLESAAAADADTDETQTQNPLARTA